jgi:hypothetical protein
MIAHETSVSPGGVNKSRDNGVKRSSEPMPPCPRSECRGRLRPYPTTQGSYDSVTGLNHLRCGTCGHSGMRVPSGLHLVFSGPNEYVFHYPPALTSLIITVSPSLLAPFTWHGLTPSQAVTFMAEWLLLTGRASGIVRFAEEKLAWDDCYDYFRRGLIATGWTDMG